MRFSRDSYPTNCLLGCWKPRNKALHMEHRATPDLLAAFISALRSHDSDHRPKCDWVPRMEPSAKGTGAVSNSYHATPWQPVPHWGSRRENLVIGRSFWLVPQRKFITHHVWSLSIDAWWYVTVEMEFRKTTSLRNSKSWMETTLCRRRGKWSDTHGWAMLRELT